jgi:hypothetical protein
MLGQSSDSIHPGPGASARREREVFVARVDATLRGQSGLGHSAKTEPEISEPDFLFQLPQLTFDVVDKWMTACDVPLPHLLGTTPLGGLSLSDVPTSIPTGSPTLVPAA